MQKVGVALVGDVAAAAAAAGQRVRDKAKRREGAAQKEKKGESGKRSCEYYRAAASPSRGGEGGRSTQFEPKDSPSFLPLSPFAFSLSHKEQMET
jgi:hypothetical protein